MPRPDAFAIALRAARNVLAAAASFTLTLRGVAITVTTTRLPDPQWPRHIPGLDPQRDGPWPAPVGLHCQWDSGSVALQMRAEFWKGGRNDGQIGLKVCIPQPSRELLWISLPTAIGDHADGDEVSCFGSVAFNRRALPAEDFRRQSQALRALARDMQLPMPTPANAEAFRLCLPKAEILPAPEVAARHLVTLALVKLPFFIQEDPSAVQGSLYLTAEAASRAALGQEADPQPDGDTVDLRPVKGNEEREDHRFLGIHTLPGGQLQYLETLQSILGWASEEPRAVSDFMRMSEERYDQHNDRFVRAYRVMIENIGLLKREGDLLEITDAGRAWLEDPDPSVLFEALHRTYQGLLEVLVIGDRLGPHGATQTWELLKALLATDWRALNQSNFRRYWLIALGMVEDGAPTALGRAALERHRAEADAIRERLDPLLRALAPGPDEDEETPDNAEDDEAIPDSAPQPPQTPPPPPGPPPQWLDASLELGADTVRGHLGSLSLPARLPEQVAAALSSGKHLLLVGPPGTGKTELALAIAAAACSLDYCAGALCATASADWTTFDTIGGYGLEADRQMAFRPGVFLQAIERHQWLLIDELNRADVDRAFGELMTVLSGKSTDTPYRLPDGRPVSMGVEIGRSHRVPKTFRVLATMNTWDKTSLFRLSYAVQRRFAILHVGIPDPETYAALLLREGRRELGNLPPLDEPSLSKLSLLFGVDGLQRYKTIGPAVALDIIRYLRRRREAGDALAEALEMNLFSQLEGLRATPAREVFHLLDATLDGWASEAARAQLRLRFIDLFPHANLTP